MRLADILTGNGSIEKPNNRHRHWEADTQRTANDQYKRQKQTQPNPQLMPSHAAAPSGTRAQRMTKQLMFRQATSA
jgi:hypothetical protein